MVAIRLLKDFIRQFYHSIRHFAAAIRHNYHSIHLSIKKAQLPLQ